MPLRFFIRSITDCENIEKIYTLNMKRLFRPFIASLLTVSLSVATVICCCIAPSVMAHFHQAAVCSHCQKSSPQAPSSTPLETCQNQLTSGEFLHNQIIIAPKVVVLPLPSHDFLNNHRTALSSFLSVVYPPGSPPQGISLTPLYLRTFQLRI